MWLLDLQLGQLRYVVLKNQNWLNGHQFALNRLVEYDYRFLFSGSFIDTTVSSSYTFERAADIHSENTTQNAISTLFTSCPVLKCQ